MGKINLGKKLTVILCVVLCCVQTTGCDKKAVKEQAAQIAQGAKDAAAEKVDAYLESCTESDSEREADKPSMKDEPEIYERAVDDFFAAVDAGDKEKILAQFAPNVRKNDKDLEEKLDELLAFYPGPTDRCERNGNALEGEYAHKYGDERYSAKDWFAVVSGGFGEPNVEEVKYCSYAYELPEEDGEKRYVSFLVDHKKDWEILRVTIENDIDFVSLETLYRSPELD